MKTLVVYYSKDGNTEFIAKEIASAQKADLLELEPKNEIPKSGFMKYFWGGKQVLMKETPELKEYSINPGDYDCIYIGTPVWIGTLCPPIRAFLANEDFKDKNVSLFCCHSGSEYNTFKEMEQLIPNANIKAKIKFEDPLENKKDSNKKLNNWLEGKLKAS